MYVYMYVCYVCMYVRTYVCVCVYMYVTFVCIYVCMYVTFVCIYVRGVAIKKPDCFYYSFPATSMTKRRVGHYPWTSLYRHTKVHSRASVSLAVTIVRSGSCV